MYALTRQPTGLAQKLKDLGSVNLLTVKTVADPHFSACPCRLRPRPSPPLSAPSTQSRGRRAADGARAAWCLYFGVARRPTLLTDSLARDGL